MIWLEIERFSYPSIENKLVNFIAKVSISFLASNDLMYQDSNRRGHVYVCYEEFEDTKGLSSVNRRSDNTMTKRKSTNNDLQNTTQKTKDRVTQIPLKTVGELRFRGRVSGSCSTSGTHRVILVTNPVISHEWKKDWKVFTTIETYPWSFVTQMFRNGVDIASIYDAS